MNLLITGVCGFAGSVLARELLSAREGISIVGIDNLSRRGSEMNVESLRALGVDIRKVDVRDRAALDALPRCDWILDCAANPSVLAGVDGSASRDLVDQNLYGTVNLLELCKQWGAGFTLLSTSRVYSIPALAALPLDEFETRFEASPTHLDIPGFCAAGISEAFSTRAPVSLYGSTKLCSEWLALEYGEAFGFPVWINRCGVLAGAGQFGKADQGIFSYWIHSWCAGRPLRYIGFGGRGKQVRDCLHPRDLAGLLVRQMSEISSEKPRVVNLSGGLANSMSLLELSSWCREQLGPSASEETLATSATSGGQRPYDIAWMILDHTLARSAWEWRPETPLGAILEEISAHARANPDWLDKVS